MKGKFSIVVFLVLLVVVFLGMRAFWGIIGVNNPGSMDVASVIVALIVSYLVARSISPEE